MRQITIVIHRETDGWWAEAPELPGFSAAAPTRDTLRGVMREGLSFHLEDEPFETFELSVDHTPRSVWSEVVTSSIGMAQGAVKAFTSNVSIVANQPVPNAINAQHSLAPAAL